MTPEEKLLPCPLCGGEAGITPHGANAIAEVKTFAVICRDTACGCRTQWRRSEGRAVKDWNRRVEFSD